jgi:hypothetical protein
VCGGQQQAGRRACSRKRKPDCWHGHARSSSV